MFTFTGDTTSGSAVILVAVTTGILPDAFLSGSGIPANARVVSVNPGVSVTMTLAATATATGVTITHGREISASSSPQASFVAALAATVASVSSLAATPISGVAVSVMLTGSTKSFLATPFTSINASASLTGATASTSASPISSFKASPLLTGAKNSFGAAPATAFQGEFFLTGASAVMSASPLSGFRGKASVTGASASMAATPHTSFAGSVNVTGASDAHGLSVCDIVDQTLGMWGIFCRKNAPDFALDRAIHDLNHALQLVWNNADERSFWSRSTIQIVLDDGESSQTLPDTIQSVIGPCRRADNKQPLICIGSIGELETFSDLYLDSDITDVPVAYHIARENQEGHDPSKITFHVNQTIDVDPVIFDLDVVLEPPRYIRNDLQSCPLVPIPHRYVESLLLPIVRYQASTFYLFRQQDLKPTIDREYQQARIQLNLADPLPGDSGDNRQSKQKEERA